MCLCASEFYFFNHSVLHTEERKWLRENKEAFPVGYFQLKLERDCLSHIFFHS